jgi:hypothetical protein
MQFQPASAALSGHVTGCRDLASTEAAGASRQYSASRDSNFNLEIIRLPILSKWDEGS